MKSEREIGRRFWKCVMEMGFSPLFGGLEGCVD